MVHSIFVWDRSFKCSSKRIFCAAGVRYRRFMRARRINIRWSCIRLILSGKIPFKSEIFYVGTRNKRVKPLQRKKKSGIIL